MAEPSGEQDYTEWAVTLDKIAHELNIDFVGGFSALVQKGMTEGDKRLIDSIPHALGAVRFDGMQYRKDIGLPGAAESN